MDPLHHLPHRPKSPPTPSSATAPPSTPPPSTSSSTPSRPRASAPPSRSGNSPPPATRHKYGLISGLRRLTACRALGHTTIPAFLRAPQTIAQALASMVTENEIREPVTPWEKATLILNAIHEGHFDTPDTAIAALFPALPRTTRTRIRNHVSVVEALGPLLTDPTEPHHPPTRHPRRRDPVGARGPPRSHPPPRHGSGE